MFSNGILWLSIAASVILAIFHGNTLKMLPLYAIGVFISFTLSQLGMVVHHLRERERGWVGSMAFNLLGAAATLVVFVDIASTKLLEGAWIVILMIPAILLCYYKIHQHYLSVGRQLSSMATTAPPIRFEKVKHTVVIPVSGVHRGVTEAIRYALSISDDVRACYIDIEPRITARIREEWERWYPDVPFIVLRSPYRSVIAPLLEYIDDVEEICHDDMITVVIPEFVTRKRWQQLLHNQTAFFIRAALLFKRGKVVTSVRYHLDS